MTIDDWFTWATADATQRKVPGLKPLLEGLRGATRELRAADWNDDAAARDPDEQTAPTRPAARKPRPSKNQS
jgi:hypothetical protein